MADPITLKHLCREYDLEPYDLRKYLRSTMEHKSNRRWKWQPDDPELAIARKHAKALQTRKWFLAEQKKVKDNAQPKPK